MSAILNYFMRVLNGCKGIFCKFVRRLEIREKTGIKDEKASTKQLIN